MNNDQLTDLAECIAKESFGRAFWGRAVFNTRFRARGGDVNVRTGQIRVSRSLFEVYGIEAVAGVIRHELCHLFLYRDGRPFSHRSREFRDLLQKVGGPRHAPAIPGSRRPRRFLRYYYRCAGCGARFAADYQLGFWPCPQCRRRGLVLTGRRRTVHPLEKKNPGSRNSRKPESGNYTT